MRMELAGPAPTELHQLVRLCGKRQRNVELIEEIAIGGAEVGERDTHAQHIAERYHRCEPQLRH